MQRTRKRPIQGVLFDWDGTLVNSYLADSSAYLAMFKEMGIAWGLEELAQHYSPDWYAVYRAAKLPRKRWQDADTAWRAHYAKHSPKLISGVRRVLSRLAAKHPLGLVTSGDRDRVQKQLRAFGLTSTFAARVCSGDTKRRKPHPEPLLLALQHMRLDPASCVYVGDAPQDIQMARRAGVRAIGVLGPFPTEKGLRAEKPELLLCSLNELPHALRTF